MDLIQVRIRHAQDLTRQQPVAIKQPLELSPQASSLLKIRNEGEPFTIPTRRKETKKASIIFMYLCNT
jgi:hypothetical protein